MQILGSLVQSGRGDRVLIQKVAGDLIRRLDDSSSFNTVDDSDKQTASEIQDADAHRNSYAHLNSLKGKVSTNALVSFQ